MGPQDEIDFAPAVMALGTAAFATRLLAALNCSIAIDHLAIMRFEDRIRPPVIESAVWLGGEHVATVQRVYLERFYRLDPVLRYAGADHRVLHLHRDEIMDAEYRRTAYVRAGLLERLTVAAPDGRRLIALNLYRREQGGPFDSRDVQRVEAHAPLLGSPRAQACRHDRRATALPRPWRPACRPRRTPAGAGARLTGRELDVLARALAGLTSAGIALDLGISLNTVLTYRKRAYGRLGVTSHAELFSRCLA